jgi:hypothetical protein
MVISMQARKKLRKDRRAVSRAMPPSTRSDMAAPMFAIDVKRKPRDRAKPVLATASEMANNHRCGTILTARRPILKPSQVVLYTTFPTNHRVIKFHRSLGKPPAEDFKEFNLRQFYLTRKCAGCPPVYNHGVGPKNKTL